ncbi:hypothetical protein HDC36_003786 [Xanthomonas sp. JAI131]|uniref:hypothetical protein n=1 Tax=Xanthomonas sp. JAI131 TaxID=2723067 RepID=UPI0015C74C41|nr:hypothetical protein [Xanthomonas sp. JAI131]NYF22310.1 hypothetical protein [Xanthomonas sp. JAI131]
MRPWERRLRDLAQLLSNCGETYFSPERFRQTINQFLQTSRTVTFIIQKNKATIPEFESWYKTNVLQPWATDPIMSWAKDARNVIEKEGDLDMQSTLQATLLYSYSSDEDMVLEVTREELLKATTDRLLQIAGRQLPPGIADSAVLKIQRRWVANTLPDRELIFALTYVYAQLYRACSTLAAHLESALDPSVLHPTTIDPSSNDVAKVRFIKFGKSGVGRHANIRIAVDTSFRPPPALLRLKEELTSMPRPTSLIEIVAMHAKMAWTNFELHGNHVPMLALYDKEWNQIDFMSTAFADQAEKYLFWRNVADRAFYLKAFALVWISEAWVRDLKEHQNRPVRDLPIIGEQLHVVGADASDLREVVAWNITRPIGANLPVLSRLEPGDALQPGKIFFIKPVVEAMKMAHTSNAS